MKKNIFSRRDFLKVAGVTSAGLALSACGLDVTKLPESAATVSMTPLPIATATNTLEPTITATPRPPTVGDLGRKLGLEIGACLSLLLAKNNFNNPDYVNAILNFSFITDGQASNPAMTDAEYGEGYPYLEFLSKFAKEHGMSFSPDHLFYGWGHFQDYSPIKSLASAPKEEIEKWMLERVKKFFDLPYFTEINFATEALNISWNTKQVVWQTEHNPFYHAYGEDWPEVAYHMAWDAAVKSGRIVGKDVHFIWDSAITIEDKKYEFDYLKKLKGKLSADLGIERPFDIGIQLYPYVNKNGCWGADYRIFEKKRLIDLFQKWAEIGDIRDTGFNVCGTDDMQQQKDILRSVVEAMIASGVCKRFLFWDTFAYSEYERNPNTTPGEFAAKNVFDGKYKPLFMLDELYKILESKL